MLGIQVTDPWALVTMIISISVCAVLLIYCVVPWLVKKKYPVNEWLTLVTTSVKKIETILHIVGKNDTDGRYTEKLQLYNNIMNITKDAVHAAEQLYKTKELDASQRKDYAIEYTKRALQTGGISVSHEIEYLIMDSIESSVMFLNTLNNNKQKQISSTTTTKK